MADGDKPVAGDCCGGPSNAKDAELYASVCEERDAAKEETRILKAELTSKEWMLEQYFKRIADAEAKLRRMQNKDFSLNYTALHGHTGVLWVQDLSGNVDAGQFAKLTHQIKRQLPDIELILLTSGAIRLWELEDAQLNRLGLARISREIPKESPKALESKPLLEKKDDGSEVDSSG